MLDGVVETYDRTALGENAVKMAAAAHYDLILMDLRMPELDGLQAEKSGAFARELSQLAGVVEAIVIAEERVAYLKVDRTKLDETQLDALLVANELR